MAVLLGTGTGRGNRRISFEDLGGVAAIAGAGYQA